MRVTTVEEGKARLHVVETGDGGSAVTLLHAGVADSRSWLPVMEVLSQSHRAVSYDQRDYGETTYAAERYSHSGDLVAVLDALGIESTILVGCSQGGQVAFDAAVRHPDRVEGLVLIG